MDISKHSRTVRSLSQPLLGSSSITEPLLGSSSISEPKVASSSISEPTAASSRIPCIYKVHKPLRDVNPGAYEPVVIAIGPYHLGKDHLKMMEDHKLRYRESLFKRKEGSKEEMYANVGELESEARKCYANKSFELDEKEFIEMLVLDGCFIVELVLKFHNKDDDLLFQMGWIISSLQRDLMLFENQLPFFVLCEVFDVIEGHRGQHGKFDVIEGKRGQHGKLMILLSNFFSDLYPGKGRIQEPNSDSQVMHLLDLIHRSWLPPPSNSNNTIGEEMVISNATALKDANVKFKMEEKNSLFEVEFKKGGVMVMAPLLIQDWTECFLRNLIAHEQYFCQFPNNFVTDYVRLLDCLINSAKDVELLKRKHIITNYLGDDEVVAKMVNTLCDSLACGNSFHYAQTFKQVNDHSRKRWNKSMAMLKQKYFYSPWAVISIVVGAVLLVLTVTQTVFAILPVVGPK